MMSTSNNFIIEFFAQKLMLALIIVLIILVSILFLIDILLFIAAAIIQYKHYRLLKEKDQFLPPMYSGNPDSKTSHVFAALIAATKGNREQHAKEIRYLFGVPGQNSTEEIAIALQNVIRSNYRFLRILGVTILVVVVATAAAFITS